MKIAPLYQDTYGKLKKMKSIKCNIIKNAHSYNEDKVCYWFYQEKNVLIKNKY